MKTILFSFALLWFLLFKNRSTRIWIMRKMVVQSLEPVQSRSRSTQTYNRSRSRSASLYVTYHKFSHQLIFYTLIDIVGIVSQ
jgi:hypothetical protein